jgi:hypothetical protein
MRSTTDRPSHRDARDRQLEIASRLRLGAVVLAASCIGVLLSGSAACGKKTLDKNVDRLVGAVQKNDYEAFKGMCKSGLAEQFPPVKFERLHKAIDALGSYNERTMQGIHVKSGGYKEGRYELEFDKGTIKLVLKLQDGKLIGFKFSGDPLEAAAKKIASKENKKPGELKVLGMRFLDGEGKPKKESSYPAGTKMPFKVGVQGLTKASGTMQVRADLQVVDSKGKVVLHKAGFVDTSISVKPDSPPVATLSGKLTIGKPGKYEVKLRVIDVPSKRALTYEKPLLVTGSKKGAGEGRPTPAQM